jgi:uncharacterized coiled-coil DUF342 family protein
MQKMFFGILLLGFFACEPPREASRDAQKQEAIRETRQQAVRQTEARIAELDQALGSFRAELRDDELNVDPQIVNEREQSLLERRALLDEKVQRYNNAIMSGTDMEAADLKAEINREIDEILAEIVGFRKERERLIDP